MRGRKAPVRKIKKDAVYSSELVTKLINYIMQDGKRNVAEKVVYTAMDIASKELKAKDPLDILKTAIANITPSVEVRTRRIGGGNYQVPVPVSERRGLTLAIRWLVSVCRLQKGKPIAERLAKELVSAFNNEGDTIKKRETVEKMAEANKAFAQFRY